MQTSSNFDFQCCFHKCKKADPFVGSAFFCVVDVNYNFKNVAHSSQARFAMANKTTTPDYAQAHRTNNSLAID